MSTVLLQYEKFYQSYYSKMNIFEKRLSNLILDNFHEIEPLGTSRGQRGRKIAVLINENKTNILSKKIISEKSHQTITSDFRLDSMEIEKFRGFSSPETIDLSKDFTFVYGPNGTGKSCFCEALEYSLLGSIEEAITKKIPMNQYIKNVFTDSVKEPVVYAKIGNEIKVIESNPELFSFCFIEKNRIEKFARIAADSPSDQQQKLAALFGLDEWNSFVKNFNSEINAYLPKKDEEEKKFNIMKKTMKKDAEFLENVDCQKKEVTTNVKSITSKYENIKNLKEFIEYVDGTEGKVGKIAELESQIKEKETLKKIDAEILTTLKERADQLKNLNLTIEKESTKLMSFKKEMSLKDFYQQILNSKVENKCPACLSDLYTAEGKLIVPQDPYEKASSYLEEIRIAIDLEQNLKKNNDLFSKSLATTKNLLEQASRRTTPLKRKEDVLFNYSILLNKVIENQTTFEKISISSLLQEIPKLEEEIITHNEKVAAVTKEKNDLEKKLKRILIDKRKALDFKAQFKAFDKQEKEIKNNLEKAKKNLLKQKILLDEENSNNFINEKYWEGYQSLLQRIVEYSEALPLKLVESLEEKVLEIYNEINKNDFEGDKLASIILPKTSNEKILISFVDKPKLKLDALLVLSEGHVKCLGLALLLSKIITENLPLIIFDDVVNAIDDEHRSAIAELITSHKDISNRQCIVTTHGSNYMETLENKVPKKLYKEKVTRVTFSKPLEKGKINILPHTSSRNLLERAEKSLEENDFSNCLTFCRKSVEKLADEVWRVYYKYSNKPIELKLKGKKDHPESNNIFTRLIKEYNSLNVPAFDNLITIMKSIVDLDKNHNILWSNMNVGTHHSERDFEFDDTLVTELLNLLIKADEEINCNIKINNRGKLTYKGILQELKSENQ